MTACMLPSHRQQIVGLIENACAQLGVTGIPIVLERPKVEAHGDVATNVALQIAKAQKKSPREAATQIAATMRAAPEFSSLLDTVEVAGPGFINLRLAAGARQQVVREALQQAERFGTTNTHAAKRVMVEFVSANPTGPLHLGHARQAALGDALANLLAAQGWQSHARVLLQRRRRADREPDAVGAVACKRTQRRGDRVSGNRLSRRVHRRDRARLPRGDDRARWRDGGSGDIGDLAAIQHFAVAYLRNEQDRDLAALGVHFDSYFLESSLYSEGKVAATVDAMTASGMTYEHEGALWLRTTAFGADQLAGLGGPPADDKDRVMRKSDGSYTYFVPDVAYHTTKLQRGFDKVVNVQGTDHYGTVARVRAGLQAAAKSLGIRCRAATPITCCTRCCA